MGKKTDKKIRTMQIEIIICEICVGVLMILEILGK